MFLGDSNTNGIGVTLADASFRGAIDRWGQTAPGGYYVDMMGPVQFATRANSNHGGYNGATILDHLNGSVPLNMSTPAQLTTAGYTPDVIVLLIGTNDANNSATDVSATMLTNYASLLAAWRAAQPGRKILACTLPDSATGTTDTNVNNFNAGLPGVIATENGLGGNVVLVPLGAGLGANPGVNFADNLHLSVVGGDVAAGIFETSLLANW
jgi:lysophospholipase L1-like esterase